MTFMHYEKMRKVNTDSMYIIMNPMHTHMYIFIICLAAIVCCVSNIRV